MSSVELVGPQRHQREQAEKCGGRPRDRRIRPLPLGLNTKMTADFGKGDLDGPAADEPAKDVERVGVEIGAQESLWLEFIGNVANQYIADRHQAAGGVPDGGAGNDLQEPPAAALPP